MISTLRHDGRVSLFVAIGISGTIMPRNKLFDAGCSRAFCSNSPTTTHQELP